MLGGLGAGRYAAQTQFSCNFLSLQSSHPSASAHAKKRENGLLFMLVLLTALVQGQRRSSLRACYAFVSIYMLLFSYSARSIAREIIALDSQIETVEQLALRTFWG